MIEEKFGYKFKNPHVLSAVMSHSSCRRPRGTASEFERAEFLGDKVLALVLTDILYEKYKGENEGDLSVRLAYLSGKNFVSQLFKSLNLLDDFRLTTDCQTDAVFTDCVEAVLGAIFVDSGYASVRRVVARIWGEWLDSSLKKDPKSRLQEFLQSRGLGLPVYEVVGKTGPENDAVFTVRVGNPNVQEFAEGSGRSKKDAEHAAADKFLKELDV